MKSYPSTEMKQSLGDVLSAASREPVAITRHGKPRFVLMSIEEFERRQSLDPRRAYGLDDAPDEVVDMLLAALTQQLGEPENG